MAFCNLRITIAVTVYLLMSIAHGEIYKWIDESGKTHFSDEKPDKGPSEQVEVQVNSIDTVSISASDFLEGRESRLDAKMRRQVVMYSAVWCGYCKKARRYFQQQGIPFKEFDIETSRKGKRDYAKLNGTGVPIIFVSQKRMQGFRAERFQAIYDQANRDEQGG
ncbi:MAG: DUF4124 domain-containing protein [Porticoccus sp.]|nr:DUF4124 domain-containing protein [Porticoccus sp.]MBQ0807995.1 DUF4124 domain-containing protein [Porticoccus sp.]